MHKFARTAMLWTALAAIGVLALLSALGAFYGAAKARAIFNSIPLCVYWCVLSVVFVAGFLTFPRLLRRPGLLSIHAGCLLVLAGGMWGSHSGHQLANRLLGRRKIPKGYLVIYEGHSEKHLLADDLRRPIGELPFSIMLKDFRLEYYRQDQPPSDLIWVETKEGQRLQLAAHAGHQMSLGDGRGKITVIRTFRNFKIRIEEGQKVVTDDEANAENPAVEVEIERPDGTTYRRYVFERFPGFSHREEEFHLSYVSKRPGMIRDFYSDIAVIESGRQVISKTIEVNHPLRYGGYHFYQHSYDADEGKYTILSVTSDSGLYAVFGGYWMLALGVLWHFWFGHAARRLMEYRKAKGGL